MTSKANPIPIDWTAQHGPTSAAVNAAMLAATTASVGAMTGAPAWAALAAGVSVGAVHALTGLRNRLTRRVATSRATAWLLNSGWASVAMATDPTSWGAADWWTAAGSLLVVGVATRHTMAGAIVHEEAADTLSREAAKQVGGRTDWETVDRWTGHIKALTRQDVTPVAYTAREGGFLLDVELPAGLTLAELQSRSTALAQAARLPKGCVVAVTEGGTQGIARLDVDTLAPAAQADTIPHDFSPLSVVTGVPIGTSGKSGPAVVELRENNLFVTGMPGSGKTTTLHNLYAGLSRCPDVVVWGIDLGKRGKDFRAWNRGDAPLFDWIATTPDDAAEMLTAATAVHHARLSHRPYEQRSEAAGLQGSYLVDQQMPQILIVIDEGATFLDPKNKGAAGDLLGLLYISREAGVRSVMSITDASAATLSDNRLSRAFKTSVVLTASGGVDLAITKMFRGARVPDVRQMTAVGSGLVGTANAPQAFRSYDVKPADIAAHVAGTAHLRARLDAVSVKAAGSAYAQRHVGGAAEASPTPDAPARRGPVLPPKLNLHTRPATPLPDGAEHSEWVTDAALAAFLDDSVYEKPTAPDEPTATDEPTGEQPGKPTGRELGRQPLNLGQAGQKDTDHEAKVAKAQALRDAGMSVRDVAAEIGMSRGWVDKWTTGN